ncbi:outer membrane protein transport protein [Pontiellaceae bacterium B12227]|nr:outer membrane protein transport protein [Pontiellaceae bacterium B12227]
MKRCKWFGILCSTLVAGTTMGAGFQLYTEGSAEALGQAGAISGRTNLTSSAWYNPSALAGTQQPKIMVGSAFASIHTDYKSGVPQALFADAKMSDEWRAIPHLYYVQPISKDVTTMLSINAPYGLITEWDDDWAGAGIATYSELRTIYITPSVAWQAFDMLAISAGLNIVDAEADLRRTGSKVEGDDIAYGGTISAHLQPLEDWALGCRYQSSVKLDITGSANSLYPASAELELPASLNVGLANTTFKNLSLGLDLVWTEWSTYDELSIVTPPSPSAPTGITTVPKNWDDVISIRLGGEYALGESWLLRAGYVWDESPVPDSTRAPEMPGSDRQMLTFGAGWKWNGMTIDAAYSYLWAKTAKMGTDPIYGGFPGEFETTTHLLALSLGYNF